MQKPTIYIAGKISGEDLRETTAKFQNIAYKLRAKGYSIINPLDLCQGVKAETEEELWNKCMKECISTINQWDGIFLIKDWCLSKGAKIEACLAKQLNIPIYYSTKELTDLLFEDELQSVK